MQDHAVSVRVSLVVVMAVLLMCGSALAGDQFTLRPRADEYKQWPYPPSGDHWSQVDDVDGFRDGADTDTIAQNESEPDPVTDIFDLNSITKPRPVTVWTVRGVVCARGKWNPVAGTGRVQVWVRKGGDYVNMGQQEVTTTAGEFEGLRAYTFYYDWTQQEIDEAKIKVKGWRPVYPYGLTPACSTHVEEVRVFLFCSDA